MQKHAGNALWIVVDDAATTDSAVTKLISFIKLPTLYLSHGPTRNKVGARWLGWCTTKGGSRRSDNTWTDHNTTQHTSHTTTRATPSASQGLDSYEVSGS